MMPILNKNHIPPDRPNLPDFKSGTSDYTYDLNGNMVKETGREFTIAYNHLNLPVQVTGSYNGATTNIFYTYTFDGAKLRRRTVDGDVETVTDYVGPFVFETINSQRRLSYILMPEGRLYNTAAYDQNPVWEWQYFLKDHLGNVRLVIRGDDPRTAIVCQENHYYSFGMRMADLGSDHDNPYLYNGKEFQPDLELNWYDYGARYYDASLGRFFSIDPLAEKFLLQSPYCYAANNPIKFIDYNGLGPGDRVLVARSMIGIEYKQETVSSLRTENTTEARQYMDCSEFVCRVLDADQITQGVKYMKSSDLKAFFDNNDKFIHSIDPQVGDIAVWQGHVGIVTVVGDDGKIKLTHARGVGKLSKENPYAISPEEYRDSEFYGYFRPVKETPDGKIDDDGNPVTNNNQQSESKTSNNTSVENNEFMQQISNLPKGRFKIVNGQFVFQ